MVIVSIVTLRRRIPNAVFVMLDLKNNLSAHGGVVKRFKMLTYYVYAPLFHRSTPSSEP